MTCDAGLEFATPAPDVARPGSKTEAPMAGGNNRGSGSLQPWQLSIGPSRSRPPQTNEVISLRQDEDSEHNHERAIPHPDHPARLIVDNPQVVQVHRQIG